MIVESGLGAWFKKLTTIRSFLNQELRSICHLLSVFNIGISVLKKCFLLLTIALLAIASGCSSDAPAPSNTEGGGVQQLEIDVDSGA